jgi:hypothetical protein
MFGKSLSVSRASLYSIIALVQTMTLTGIHLIGLHYWKKKYEAVLVDVAIPLEELNPNEQNQNIPPNNNRYNVEILCSMGYFYIWLACVVSFVVFTTQTAAVTAADTIRILARLAEDWLPSVMTSIFLPLILFRRRPAVKAFVYEWYNLN